MDDPWEANTLEGHVAPPPYNFDRLPEIRSERPLFDARHGLVDPHSTPPIPPSVAAGEDELTTTPDSKA